ncbi:superoxide dismutase family protein [Streptomyces xanthii]|uniref:Superoxide dismutase family protein n=1 Tax=Streptomyces xanthii TaxID=2768069 RepID=A0A7H1BJM1_9ACTN|nr:superoxide dismutase family protein [Streptomyces xanthii]QNS08926.1 superoxide dismutase family protein [Streptomyces xanthii]
MVTGMVSGVLAAAVLATGGAGVAGGAPGGGGSDAYWLRVEGRFAPPTAFVPSAAVTYDDRLVPPGASIEVEQEGGRGDMTVRLAVEGLEPGRAYGAHVHREPCGADPEAAGGHYRHEEDPGRADAANEVWLDFTTDRAGDGRAVVHKAWGLRRGEADSVVLHDAPGGAGHRVACFTVPFASLG